MTFIIWFKELSPIILILKRRVAFAGCISDPISDFISWARLTITEMIGLVNGLLRRVFFLPQGEHEERKGERDRPSWEI